jgi:hypothetical protein
MYKIATRAGKKTLFDAVGLQKISVEGRNLNKRVSGVVDGKRGHHKRR